MNFSPPAFGPRTEPFPRFSDMEMAARRQALAAVMVEYGVEHCLIYGANRFGSAVGWLTRWPVTREAVVVFTPGQRDLLLVSFYNHVANAKRIATEPEVRWTGPSAMNTALDELRRRGAAGARIGITGPLGFESYARLVEFADAVVDLNPGYLRLRLIKSAEEIDWLRVGTELTDRALRALCEKARAEMNGAELGNLVERAYVALGGTTHIHYFGITSMTNPDVGVPAQWPSARRLHRGDALLCEVSASFWGYTGQVLRTFTVEADPTPLYRELHDVAEAAFEAIFAQLRPGATAADLVAAACVIEEAGFTTCDDLVHGFVGGYLPPVLGSKSRTLEPVPDFTFEPGMTVVIQPNVVTPDGRAGVQTGELVLLTPEGAERLHRVDPTLTRIG